MGQAAEVPGRWIQVWYYCFGSFPGIKKFMAGKKYFRWRPGDCAGSEIILGLIFRPWSGRWSTCKMNTAMILLFLPISGHQKIYKYSSWMPGDCPGSEIILGSIFRPWVRQLKYLQDEYKVGSYHFSWFLAIKKLMAGKKYFSWMPSDCAGSEIQLGSISQLWVGQVKCLQDEYR